MARARWRWGGRRGEGAWRAVMGGRGLRVVADAVVERREVVEAGGGVGMVGAKGLLPDGEGALVEGRGLRIVAHAPVERRQVVEALGGVGMVGAKGLLPDGEGAL